MTDFGKATLLGALLIPGVAAAQISAGDVAGTTEADIVAFLTAQGYDVVETELEGDEFEAEATLDGVLMEIEVSLTSGLITEVEMEDDEDDYDDEDEDENDDEDDEDGEDDDDA